MPKAFSICQTPLRTNNLLGVTCLVDLSDGKGYSVWTELWQVQWSLSLQWLLHLPFCLDVVDDMVHCYRYFIGKNCDGGNDGGNDTGYCVWTKWMTMVMTMVIAQTISFGTGK